MALTTSEDDFWLASPPNSGDHIEQECESDNDDAIPIASSDPGSGHGMLDLIVQKQDEVLSTEEETLGIRGMC
jgi:hypothetical protein